MKALASLLVLACLAGCETAQVQPWERGTLARNEMQWQPDVMEAQIRDHIHYSKEASTGSAGAAGGGCGCN
ncbi:MAG: DUF4266 domain-containing protein [Halieaceae bacterium]